MEPSARAQGIDLLRGIAVGLVLLRHALPDQFAGAGVVGIVMFFSLSGYLITGLLLDELDRTGTVRLRRFYAYRALRLVPALALLIAVIAIVTVLLDPLGDADELPRTVIVALTWTANLPFPHGSDAIFHLWTLATEEQFYLLWPALLLLGVRTGRVGLAIAAAGGVGLLACVGTLVWLHPHPDLAYALPTSWVGCFVIGGAARFARDSITDRIVLPRWLPAVAIAVLLVLSVLPVRGHTWTYLGVAPLVAALTAVLMLRWSRWTVVLPALRPLAWLGVISYGAYLWNYPLTLWLRPLSEYGGLIAIALTIAAAMFSWWALEKPLARLRAPIRQLTG